MWNNRKRGEEKRGEGTNGSVKTTVYLQRLGNGKTYVIFSAIGSLPSNGKRMALKYPNQCTGETYFEKNSVSQKESDVF